MASRHAVDGDYTRQQSLTGYDLFINTRDTNRVQLEKLEESNRLNNESTISANRAWIAPIDMILIPPIIKGQNIRYKLSYQNTGHAPAEELVFQDDQTDVRKAPMKQFETITVADSPDWIGNGTCVPLQEQEQGTRIA